MYASHLALLLVQLRSVVNLAHVTVVAMLDDVAHTKRERRIHEETKMVADKIVATADNMDTIGSHITAKQHELEVQLSKVLKTVVIV